jgi:arginyl-tRNA synthetase
VGFPTQYPGDYESQETLDKEKTDPYYQNSYITRLNWFRTYVHGKRVPIRIKKGLVPEGNNKEELYFPQWYTWSMIFAANQRVKVTNRYRMENSSGGENWESINYILRSGSTWKGPIGKVTVRMRLEEYSLPPCIVLKTDGATLYSTRDLAAAEYRKKTFDFYKALYVVAYQQSLHFRQLFAVLEKMGKPWAGQCEHVAFGMVSLEDGTLSTREGKIVLLEDVLNRSIEKTLATINEKNPELENKEDVARQVGIGAVLYSTLSAGRIKDITFSFDRVLNFDGETGPYVQYTHARASSVLRKYEGGAGNEDYSALDNDEAFAVVRQIADFPSAVLAAADKNEPYLITRHITLLAQYFNKYYYECRIMDSDESKTKARIQLTRAVQKTIRTGLSLLGIAAPERM